MSEDEAENWIREQFGDEVTAGLKRYRELLIEGTRRHNLISSATIDTIWSRHFVDSAQLITMAGPDGTWLDIGSGAGLPGLVVALTTGRPVILVEPRRLRAEFLVHAIERLAMDSVQVRQIRVEKMPPPGPIAVISARAVASLDKLFAATDHLRSPRTVYVLPRGRSVKSEVAAIQGSWHGLFHVEHSIVSPDSGIVVAAQVSRR